MNRHPSPWPIPRKPQLWRFPSSRSLDPMTSSGSTLLFGAIPAELKPSAAAKRGLVQFVNILCRRLPSRPLVCFLADDAQLRELKRDFLDHDYSTDVLSSPATSTERELGQIAISV